MWGIGFGRLGGERSVEGKARWRQALRRRLYTNLLGLGAFIAITIGVATAAVGAGAPPMTVPGRFEVNPSGAATYSIPIGVPPGTSGIQPVLSLDYSSQSGDGIVGLGWMLSGLESIERCPRTYDQDGVHGGVNFDANDRFCFEGQRLVAVSGTYGADGTVYHTEIDTFSKVVSYGSAGTGPAYFKVWTKLGQVMEFGNTTDSRPLTTTGSGTARSWALNKVSDAKGNYFTVTYMNDTANGQIYPTEIDYTGNANSTPILNAYNSVRFVYNNGGTVPRPDVTALYHAGSMTQTTVRLTNIQSYTGSTLVYDYRLAYNADAGATRRSRLVSVTLCDGGNNCLKPTTFGWQGSRDNFSITTSSVSGEFSGATLDHSIFADFNGDGVTDALGTQNIPLATGNGSSTLSVNIPLLVGNGMGQSTSTSLMATYPRPVGNPNGAPAVLGLLDNNGDGLSDFTLMQRYDVSNGDGGSLPLYMVWVADNNGDSTATATAAAFGNMPTGNNYDTFQNIEGDFDGSGKTTFTNAYNTTQLTDGVSVNVADFDGDGCSDILTQMSSDHAVTYSCNPAVSSTSVNYWGTNTLVLGDFNGDGMTDILVVPNGSNGNGGLYLSSGTGFVTSSYAVPASWTGAGNNNFLSGSHVIFAGDWDGDGKTDIAEVTTSAINYYISTGNGFTLVASKSITWDGSLRQIADLNNDGVSDILLGDTAYSISYTPELMTSVSNGLGATTTITYDRLNKNGSFYAKCPNNTGTYVCGDAYPTEAVDGPIYVVSQVDSSNAVGGTFTTSYSYAGDKMDLRGRGSLGFERITATQQVKTSNSTIVTTTKYDQTFPYIGRILSQTTTTGSTTLSSVTNTYEDNALGTGTAGVAIHFPIMTQSVATGSDLDGSALPTTTVVYHYDCQDAPSSCYGNLLTKSETVSTDGVERSSKTTTNAHWNDPTHWFIGRVTGTTVTRTVASDQDAIAANSAPTAANDSVTTNENTAKTFDPRDNDSDPDGDALTIIAASTPSHGSVVISGGTSLTYTPANMYSGSDSFTYTISDGQGHTATATVSMTVAYVAPPSGTLTASATAVAPGASATLSWTSSGASSASIDNGIGSVTPVTGGSVSIKPSATTTYTLTLDGLGGTTAKNVTVEVIPTPTGSFSASPTSISPGGSSTLSWSSTNATSASIDNGVGTVSTAGSVTVTPGATTTYTLTLTGPTGTLTKQMQVTVVGSPSGTLTANPASINLGSSSTLTWSTTNATSASINNGVGAASPVSGGHVTVTPTANTTYTLTVTNSLGVTNATTATVTIPAPSGSFTASPTAIPRGQATTIIWSSTNATSASIDNGVGTVATSGSETVSPTTTTTYHLTLTGPSGTTTIPLAVTVYQPPTATFSASPTTVNLGSASTLSWSTTNATSVSIDHGVGTVTPVASGSRSVIPTASTTYTLTATGPGGTITKSIAVSIPAPSGSFSVSSANITAGQSATLSWSSTNATSASINGGVGTVATSGSKSVSPGSTTTYTLTLSGPSGSTTRQVTVNVYPVPTASISANPTTVNRGSSSTLNWSSTGAVSASVDNGIGSVAVSGSKSVSPTTTTAYTITVTNATGTTATSSTTVTVVQPPVAVNDSAHAQVLSHSPILYGLFNFNPLTNDSDPNGYSLSIINANATASIGSVSFTSSSISWEGPAYFSGTVTVQYEISDGHGNTAYATVTIYAP